VNDCTVRAISLATKTTWDDTYRELSEYAQKLATMPDDVIYIDGYLDRRFTKVYEKNKSPYTLTVEDFARANPFGTFLITMSGHITCCIDGCIYDTFNPKDRIVWEAYRVK
jgi:hypothetical protein